MAHDVFVSHSTKDKAVADAVVARLEAESVSCWVAPRDVVPGADWGESIINAIESSRIMVLIFSQSANASPQIKREVERAVNKGVYIIPFRVEDIPPAKSLEYFISTSQWMDAFPAPLERHLDNLAKTINSVLKSPRLPGATVPTESERLSIPKPAISPQSWRKSILIAVGMAVLMIVGGAGWYLVHNEEHAKEDVSKPSTPTKSVSSGGMPSAHFPAYEEEAINIWIVGSPHTGALPPSRLPHEIADNARSVFASIDVKTFRAEDFAATFFAAFEMHSEPDVLVIDNYGIIDGITTPLGNFVGIASKAKVRDALMSTSESFSSFGSGWQFLISTSRNHEKAKALAMASPRCKPEFMENVSGATPEEIAQIRATAISAAYAYLTCNKEGIASLSDKDRLGSGCVNDKEPFFTKTVDACCVLGNDKLSFVPLVASFSTDRAVGQKTVLAVLRKTIDKWQLLTITEDPDALGLLNGPLRTLAASLIQNAPAVSPMQAAAELITPDWTFPAPSGAQRFGSFTWKPSPSPDVVGEVVEFEYGPATRLFISFDMSQSPKQISTGQLWTTKSIWHWRVWSIAKSGRLALSQHRSFNH